MKKTIITILMFLLMISSVIGVTIQADTNANLQLPTCYNNQSGQPESASATLTCRDSAWNTDISSASATQLSAGKFNYTFNLNEGFYSCELDCNSASALDPVFTIEVRPDYFDDAGGDTVALTSATETQIDNIETDTSAQDTSSELRTLLTGSDTAVSTLTENSNIGIDLDDTTGTLDAAEIGGDAITSAKIAANAIGASELAENSITSSEIADNSIDAGAIAADAIGASEAGFLTDSTGFAGADIAAILTDTGTTLDNYIDTEIGEILGALDGNLSSILGDTNELQSNQNWNVWDDGTRTLTTADWTTDSDLTPLFTAIDQNQSETETHGDSNWATAVGFSTHSAADVDDVISDEEIITAIDGNASLWTTATGFSTHNESDVYEYFTAGSNEDAFKGTGTGTSPDAVYDYFVATGRALNETDGWIKGEFDALNDTSASDVYTYFTSGSNENQFKADVSALALASVIDSNFTDVFGEITTVTSNQDTLEGNISDVRSDISGLNDITAQNVWEYVTRTLTSFGSLVTDIDTQLNSSHSEGNWSDAGGSVSLTQQNIDDIAVGVVNATVNSTYPGNAQGLGTRVYYIEVRP